MISVEIIKRIRPANVSPPLRLWVLLFCSILQYPLRAQENVQSAVSAGAGLVSGGNYTGYVSAGQQGTYLYANNAYIATAGIILNEISGSVEFTFELAGNLTENENQETNALVLKAAKALLQGNPLAFVNVFLILVETGEVFSSTQTDANGYFRFENVPYKNFYFTVNTPEIPEKPLTLTFESNIFVKKVEINGEVGTEGIEASVVVVPQNTCSPDHPDYRIWYLDADGDGYGNPKFSVGQCTRPTGYVANGEDCDDADPGRHPGAADVPGSGVDNNCDGIIENNPPVADAGTPQFVNSGETVILDASASTDPDGYPLSFEWISPEGIVLDNYFAPDPRFTAPTVTSETVLTFMVVVTDNLGLSDADEVIITVTSGENSRPVAHAGHDFEVNEGATVRLDGRGSYDPDGDSITYQWTAPAGINLQAANSAVPQFTAPLVNVDTPLEFVLVVNDGSLDSAPDMVVVTVRNVNNPPVAVCNELSVMLNSSGLYTLTSADLALLAQGSTDDHTPFSQLNISAHPSSFSCSDIGNPVEVTLTVTDQHGETATCTTLIVVVDGVPPVFGAGKKSHKVTITEGEVYLLPDLSSLFPANDACGVTYYEQVPAPGTPYHQATSETILLTAYDASGNSATTTVSFTLSVRKLKKKSAEIEAGMELLETELLAFPNPFTDRLNIEFGLTESAMVKVEIYNSMGLRISQLFEGYLDGGVYNRFEFKPHGLASQMLIYQVTVQDKVYHGKVIYTR